jgi:hypothetical protein
MSKITRGLGLALLALVISLGTAEAAGHGHGGYGHGGGWHGGGWHGGGWRGGGWGWGGPYWGAYPGYYYGPSDCGWVRVRVLRNGYWVVRRVWRCW